MKNELSSFVIFYKKNLFYEYLKSCSTSSKIFVFVYIAYKKPSCFHVQTLDNIPISGWIGHCVQSLVPAKSYAKSRRDWYVYVFIFTSITVKVVYSVLLCDRISPLYSNPPIV